MPGLADLLYLGQPNPQMQLARALSGQIQPQQPTQPGPPGPSPTGGPAPAPQAPPAPGNPSPGSPPGPAVLQSSPDMAASYAQLASPQANDLMSLYLQAQQRAAASDQINRGFALIAANHAGNPAMAHAIMESASGGGMNPAGSLGDLMNIYRFQQQQAGYQNLLSSVPDLASQSGLSENVVRSMIMSGQADKIFSAMEPPQMVRDYQWAVRMYKQNHPNATQADIDRDVPQSLFMTGMMGGGDMTKQWQQERAQILARGDPLPWGTDDLASYSLWRKQQDELTQDQTEAKQKRTAYVQNLTDLRGALGDIVGLKQGDTLHFKPDGTLDTSNLDPAKYAALQHALNAPFAQAYLNSDPTAFSTQYGKGAALTTEDKHILDQIRSVTDPKSLFGTMGQRAPKRGQSDVSNITSGLHDMTNINQPNAWLGSLGTVLKGADAGVANAFGASGEAEGAPDYTKPYMNSTYLPGGSMYPYGKKPAPMSESEIQKYVDYVKANPGSAQDVIQFEKASNHDTAELERRLKQG